VFVNLFQEGDFFWNLSCENLEKYAFCFFEKKAIILITAKAHVGFDLQVRMDSDIENKRIIFT
jgi:hypothetical protein